MIQYEKYNWNIRGNLNVISLFLGKLGYTKYCCFLCEWDSRDRKYHYFQKSGLNDYRLFHYRKM